MKTIVLILKGILLYTTAILTLLIACGMDSLYEEGWLFSSLLIITILIYTCYKVITKEEFDKLVGDKDSEDD